MRCAESVIILFLLSITGWSALARDGAKHQDRNRLCVIVTDQDTGDRLPGAIVSVAFNGKDTLMTAANDDGEAFFPVSRHTDKNFSYEVSLLGYFPMRGNVFKSNFREPLTIQMHQNPEDLPEVIITAKEVAIVIKGDTTIYNTTSLKYMEDDGIRTLLEKMPGVQVSGNSIKIDGEEVKKVHLNGDLFFGSHIASALTLLKAKDVKNIKFYSEYNRERIDQADTVWTDKEKVMDVTTKRPIDRLRDINITVAPRIYPQKQKEKPIAGGGYASLDVKSYGRNAPRIDAGASAGKNVGVPGGSTPNTKIATSIKYDRGRPFKDRITHEAQVGYSSSQRESSFNAAMTDGSLRKESNESVNRDGGVFAKYHGAVEKKSGDLFIKVIPHADIRFNRTTSDIESMTMLSAGDVKRTAISRLNKEGSAEAGVDLQFKRPFKNNSLTVYLSNKASFSKGSGYSIDTTQTTSSGQWRTLSERGISDITTAVAGFSIPLNKQFRIIFSAGEEFSIQDMKDIWFDKLLSMDDWDNSVSAIDLHSISHISSEFQFLPSDKFNLTATVKGLYFYDKRSNQAPLMQDVVYSAPGFSPDLRLYYVNKPFSLSFNAALKPVQPSLIQLEKRLQTLSPLYLVAGNPELKNSNKAAAGFSAAVTLPKSRTSLKIDLSGSLVQNYVGTAVNYFTGDTLLEDFGYTAVAGSRLSRPVNMNGAWSSEASISAGIKMSFLDLYLAPAVTARFSGSPMMTNGIIQSHTSASYGFQLSANASFGTWGRLVVNGECSYTSNYRDMELIMGQLSNNLKVTAHVDPVRHWRISSYYSLHSDRSVRGLAAIPFINHLLNFSIQYSFGKELSSKILLSGEDLLNNRHPLSRNVADRMVTNSYTAYLGRAIVLSYSHTFR